MEELSVESLPHVKAAVNACAFQIRGWTAWAPGRTTEADWRRWANAPEIETLAATLETPVPVLLRRRVSPLGQAALRAAWGLPDVATARLVAASRHGEYARTLTIFDSLVARTEVSPADFTLSVHHALLGLLSIATGNRQGHTAVAAGPESFGFGLLEAAACLVERPAQPVVFLYYDEGLPAPFSDFCDAGEPPLVIALTLVAAGEPETIEIATQAGGASDAPTTTRAFDFLRFLLDGRSEATSAGERLIWHWRRYGPDA
jgi:hypothetical protein